MFLAKNCLKGTVTRDFWPLFFFHESTPYGPLIHTLKHFRILVRIHGDIQISKLFCGVSDPTEHKKNVQIGGSLSMNPICLGQCSLYMQTIFEKCPFKENGKLSKLFRLVLRGLNLPAGSDTPQNKILRGIRLRRTRPCGVSVGWPAKFRETKFREMFREILFRISRNFLMTFAIFRETKYMKISLNFAKVILQNCTETNFVSFLQLNSYRI